MVTLSGAFTIVPIKKSLLRIGVQSCQICVDTDAANFRQFAQNENMVFVEFQHRRSRSGNWISQTSPIRRVKLTKISRPHQCEHHKINESPVYMRWWGTWSGSAPRVGTIAHPSICSMFIIWQVYSQVQFRQEGWGLPNLNCRLGALHDDVDKKFCIIWRTRLSRSHLRRILLILVTVQRQCTAG